MISIGKASKLIYLDYVKIRGPLDLKSVRYDVFCEALGMLVKMWFLEIFTVHRRFRTEIISGDTK